MNSDLRLIAVYDALNERINKLSQVEMPPFPEGLATDEGLERAIKAQGKALKEAISQVIAETKESISMLPTAEKQDLGPLVSAIVNTSNTERQSPVKFDIRRDENGLLTSVIATPIRNEAR